MVIICEDVDGENICNFFGLVRIVWLRLQEIEENVIDFCVFDRLFVFGDVVVILVNFDGQMGIVMEISMFVDLEFFSGEVVEGIDSCRF